MPRPPRVVSPRFGDEEVPHAPRPPNGPTSRFSASPVARPLHYVALHYITLQQTSRFSASSTVARRIHEYSTLHSMITLHRSIFHSIPLITFHYIKTDLEILGLDHRHTIILHYITLDCSILHYITLHITLTSRFSASTVAARFSKALASSPHHT